MAGFGFGHRESDRGRDTMIPNSFRTRAGVSAQDIDWMVFEPSVPYCRAVVIAYGSDGLALKWEPEIRRHAEALSAAGILALVPDYFQKKPQVAHDNSAEVFLQIPKRHGEWEVVLRDAVSTAKALRGVDAARVGLLGFSLGGFLCLRVRDSAKALVEYFAPYRFPSNVDLGPESPLMGLGQGRNPSLKAHIHHGRADALVPLTLNADPIRTALEAEGATVTTSYFNGANHGFAGGDAANTHARDTSFDETTRFFETRL